MESISIRERFRPARIAIIIAHGDAAAFEQAVRLNTALLGGMFNPIIPYSTELQDEAIRMVRLFDPDLIHSQGQVSSTWVPQESVPRYPAHYSTLYHTGQNGVGYFSYQDVFPVIAQMWREVARFEKTPPFLFPVIAPDSTHHLLFKTVFGAFPEGFSVPYERLFRENLNPSLLTLTDTHPLPTAEPWDKTSPLRLTVSGLHQYSRGPDHPARIVFVGDALEQDSLIDFWNLRASGNEVLFVPIQHSFGFEPPVREMFKVPDPAFHRLTRKICFSRSSTEESRRSFEQWFAALFAETTTQPAHSCVSADYWKATSTRINKYFYPEEAETLAPIVEGRFQYQTVFPEWLRPEQPTLEEKHLYVAPSFRGLYRDHDYLVDFPRDPGIEDGIRKWWGVKGRITDEGLTLLRDPRHRQVHIRLPTGEEAIEAIFLARQLTIKLSEPGHVAKQIIKRLGGIERCRVFKVKAVRDTLDLLNDGKARTLQEILRTIGASLPQGVSDLFIEPEKTVGHYQAPELLALMHRLGMVQQGWRLQCGTCSMYEWYPISAIGNEFECRWCFTKHATPQLVGNPSVTFEYRASGLYRAHQKMKGSIPVITSLWRFVNSGGHFEKNVFATSVEVGEAGGQRKLLGELDFIVLMPHPTGLDEYKLILGEARGAYDYDEGDVRKIREIADRFGNDFVANHVCLCFSTLKDAFSDSEKQVLSGLARQGYEVIPLTRLDLDPYDLHERFQGMPNQYFQTIEQFAANTRQLNLQIDD